MQYPNPEDVNAFKLALELAKKVEADIILATDPDADRLGVFVKDNITGEFKAFTGNMSALLIAKYQLEEKTKRNMLPQNGVIIKTIVSSNMIKEIIKEYKLNLIEVLTGFKYIGEQIKILEKTKEYQFIFGYEESYGCLLGTYARDKDGIAAVVAICEAACYYQTKKMTLCDKINEMYEKYGYYKEDLKFFTLKGSDGIKKITNIMENLRNQNIEKIGNNNIISVRDYKSGEKTEMLTGKKIKIELPKSNVLYYELENDKWFCIRPSGTEPKIKIYLGVRGKNANDANNQLEELEKEILSLVN